ncbi:unnamed protein product [Psylliodes chrysocephalus]|uniref:Uncharacterized protein n=1 Tax=Psylliodes chrysocephalus TaxID=3402493 RepID=A0A9P0GH46_9CUCU|nr:unnamed protein product [Psylliodes chrysocephala]
MEAKTPNNNNALEKYSNTIQSTINNANKKSCPLKLIQHDQTTIAWWCHELDHLRKMARTSFNKARTTKLKEDWDTYKSHLREYKKNRHTKTERCMEILLRRNRRFPAGSEASKSSLKRSTPKHWCANQRGWHENCQPRR